MEAVPGTYELVVDLGEARFRESVTIDATRTLGRVTEIVEEELTSDSFHASWPPLEGAGSYYAEIDDPSLVQGIRGFYTSEPSANFEGLDLSPGDRFGFRIYAFSADLTTGNFEPVPSPFNASYTAAVVFYE